MLVHARIQKLLAEVVQLNSDVFLVDEVREDPIITKSDPSLADNGPILNAGLIAL